MISPRCGRVRALSRGTNGEALLEFALSLPSVIIVMLWFFELTLSVYAYTVIADSAKEGIRYATVHGALSGSPSGPVCPCPDVENVVKSFAQGSLHDISGMTVTVSYPDLTLNLPSSLVKIQVTYTLVPYLSLPWVAPTLKVGGQGRIVF